MKRSTLAVFGLCAVAALSSLTFSVVPALADNAPATTQPTGSDSGKHHRTPFAKLEKALAQLDLSADQQTKINGILADTVAKIQTTKENMKGQDKKAIREAIIPIMKDAREQVKAVLTPDQAKKLHDLMADGHEGHKEHKAKSAN